MIVTNAGMAEILANGTTGELATAKVVLSNALFAEARDTLATALIDPAYSGYAAQNVAAWSAPYIGPDLVAHIDGGDLLFQQSGGALTDTVYGWGLVDSTGDILYACGLFDDPIAIVDATSGALVDLEIGWGS